MSKKICPFCHKEFTNLPLHILSQHPEEAKKAGLIKGIPSEIEKTDPIKQKITEMEKLREKRKLRALQENELLSIELENKRMREELIGIRHQEAKPSDLEMFSKFIQIQNALLDQQQRRETQIQQQVLEDMTPEDMTPEDRIFLKLIDKIPTTKNAELTSSKGGDQQQTENKPKLEDLSEEQIIQIKQMIKNGELTKEKAREYTKTILNDDEFNKYWEELSK